MYRGKKKKRIFIKQHYHLNWSRLLQTPIWQDSANFRTNMAIWHQFSDLGMIVSRTTHCNTLQHTATHCNTLQHTATRCNTLQPIAIHCNTLRHTATHCDTMQHTAIHCDTLRHTAIHCSTLRHHTYCNKYYGSLFTYSGFLLNYSCLYWVILVSSATHNNR